MHTIPLRQRINDSLDMRILRQDNLDIYADINQRAFRGEGIAEVPIVQYLRIIKEVQESLAPGENDTLRHTPPKKVLEAMLGRTTSYKSTPWVGTDTRGGQEVVILLPHGGRVLKILSELGNDHSLLAQSGLEALTKEMALLVARLSGDVSHQIQALEEQRNSIDARIQALQEQGARPMSQREQAREMQTLTGRINAIKSGFSQIPAARRTINAQNQDTFLGIDGTEEHDAFGTMLARQDAWNHSGEHAMLESLRAVHSTQAGRQLQHHLETIATQHNSLLSKDQRVEVSRFLPDMTSIGNTIDTEIMGIWKAAEAYVRHPNYRSMRKDAWAMREAMTAVQKLCEAWQPTPRDKRLEGLGLELTLPVEPHDVCGLGFTTVAPSQPKVETIVLDDAPLLDPEQVRLAQAERIQKAAWLQDKAILGRIKDTMRDRPYAQLSEVLQRHPPRYGRQEISRYLSVAAKIPSRLDNGASFRMRLSEQGHLIHAEIINPTFLPTGAAGQGFDQAMTLVDWLDTPSLRALPLEAIDVVALA